MSRDKNQSPTLTTADANERSPLIVYVTWISLEEKAPPEGQAGYLVATYAGRVRQANYYSPKDGFAWGDGWLHGIEGVTYWSDLPEHPYLSDEWRKRLQ